MSSFKFFIINHFKFVFTLITLLFFLSPIYSTSPQESDSFMQPFYPITSMNLKCPHTTSYLKRRICGINNSDDGGLMTVFSQCPESEICTKTEVNGDLMTCVRKVKLLKEGKKCELNKECRTQYCLDKKCTAKENGFLCSSDAECGKGNGCLNGTCVALTKEVNGPCDTKKCGFGMLCNNNKCTKFGTIENGEKTSDEILCKSGMSYEDICVTVKVERFCTGDGLTVKIEFNEFDGDPKDVTCKEMDSESLLKKNYHDYLELKTTLFKKYIEEFNDVDKDSLYDSDDLDVTTDGAGLGNWKIKEKFLLYKNVGYLRNMDMIDNEGKIRKEKECEYEFFIKQAGEKRTRVITFVLITMIMLLFL